MISINEQEISPKPQNSDSEVVLSINGVSKKFCRDLKRSLLYGVRDITSELLGLREKSENLRPKEFWALNDVSFQLRRGEALGLVGKNGSGKSTILRIIAGLIKPDSGFVEVNGRVAPLIALGAGFSGILTGRENIYANMSILGLSTKEIKERFDEVIEFAEIGDAIDSPVQTYSSGMAARLGFATAIHTEPDILLIDEVLAVGDVKFRVKCTRKLSELRQKGTSFILVSHNSYAILSTCDSAVYLSEGSLIDFGDVHSVVSKYEEDLFLTKTEKSLGKMFIPEKSEDESSGLDVVSLLFRDQEEKIIESPISGSPVQLCLSCKVKKKLECVSLRIDIKDLNQEGDAIVFMDSRDEQGYLEISPGENEIRVEMPYFSLGMGLYTMEIFIAWGNPPIYTLDRIQGFNFAVEKPPNQSHSKVYQLRTWRVRTSNV